jgi:hypothetical protein
MATINEISFQGEQKWRLDLGRVEGKRSRTLHDTEQEAKLALSDHEGR